MKKFNLYVILFCAVTATQAWSNSFSCYGEAEGMLMSADLSDAETFVNVQLENEHELIGQQHCVIAELMKRLGDSRAEYHYEKAIALDPDEPGWELWYANYLTQVRGSMVPLREDGKLHYLKAIEKLKKKYGGSLDDLNEVDQNLWSWIKRGYSKMYQEDGIAITPWSWPARYENLDASDYYLPELFITYTGRFTHGLSEFDRPDYARSRASEAIWVKNADYRNNHLTEGDVKRIATHDNGSDIYNSMVRVRARTPFISVEGYAKKIDITNGMVASSMVFNSGNPNHKLNNWSEFTTLQILDVGLGLSRNFNLYPIMDVYWEGFYRSQLRNGFLEWYPDQNDATQQIDTKMKLSRFIGPDKLIIDLFYMNQNVQDVTYPTVERHNTAARVDTLSSVTLERDRWMAGIKFDYAMYRPIRFPFKDKAMYTRGWHWYAGMMFDAERWWAKDIDLTSAEKNRTGAEQDSLVILRKATADSSRAKIQNTDVYLGTHLKGIGNFDFQFQWTFFYTKPFAFYDHNETTTYAQAFTHILYRIIDEDVVPGMPDYSFISPVFLQLSFPMSYDYAMSGPKGYEMDFDNVKAQAELQAKLLINPLGAYIILTGGGGYQYYHTIDTGLPLYSGSVNIGWNF